LPRRARQDVILFTRYEKFNTQHRMPEGFTPLPQFNQHAWFAGVTYKPNADVALKFDYVWHRSASRVVQVPDGVNLGLGWWF
jgi:phosphate-selective porin